MKKKKTYDRSSGERKCFVILTSTFLFLQKPENKIKKQFIHNNHRDTVSDRTITQIWNCQHASVCSDEKVGIMSLKSNSHFIAVAIMVWNGEYRAFVFKTHLSTSWHPVIGSLTRSIPLWIFSLEIHETSNIWNAGLKHFIPYKLLQY